MHRKTGAVLASVLLVVATGSAVAFAAAGGPAEVGADAALQQDGNETAGNATDGNVTDGNVTDENVTDGNVTDENVTVENVTDGNVTPGTASVRFGNQTSNGTAVLVTSVTVSEGGFVAIHDGTWFEGENVTSVIGVSAYLDAGTHGNLTVRLYRDVPGANFTRDALNMSDQLVAMPHVDSNDNETFDYVTTNGSEDGPYRGTDDGVIENVGVVAVEEAEDGVAIDAENETDADEVEDEEVDVVGNISIGEETPVPADDEAADNETTDDETTDGATTDGETTDNETTEVTGNETADDETDES